MEMRWRLDRDENGDEGREGGVRGGESDIVLCICIGLHTHHHVD